jgi:hypothetical protein
MKPTVNSQPKLHSIAFVISVFIISLAFAYRISIDSIATIELITTPLFPRILSRRMLGWIRVLIAGFIAIVSGFKMRNVEYLSVNYLPSSKLISRPIKLTGWRAQSAFTSWSWNVLGVYFAVSGLVTLYVHDWENMTDDFDIDMLERKLKPYLRLCILLFETVAPLTMLVSAVVRYALWPIGLSQNNTTSLKHPLVMIQHNANLVFALSEVSLLGGLPVRLEDMALAPLFGVVYIVFAWSIRYRWIPSKSGKYDDAQFLYFFLDTTLEGYKPTIFLALLVLVLSVFYCLFVIIDDIMVYVDGGILMHILVVIGLASCFCRFRD